MIHTAVSTTRPHLVRSRVAWLVLGACLACAGAGPLAGCRATSGARGGDTNAQITQALGLLEEGERAIRDKDYPRAVDRLQRSVALQPSFGAAWHNLGVAYRMRNNPTDPLAAQQSFLRAAELLPTDPKPYYNLGLMYEERFHHAEAIKYFEEALRIDENHLDALRGLVACTRVLRKADQATLDHLRRGQLLETDRRWQEAFIRERIRVEADLRDRASGLRNTAPVDSSSQTSEGRFPG